MIDIIFNVFTQMDNVKIEGFLWIMIHKNNKGWMKIDITSPYTGISAHASIENDEVSFMEKKIDLCRYSPAEVVLEYLYSVCRSFEDNIDRIKERNRFYKETDEYEKYSVYDDLRQKYENDISAVFEDWNHGVICEIPHKFDEWIMESEKYYNKIKDYRFPLIDEIPIICGIEMCDDIVNSLTEKFIVD